MSNEQEQESLSRIESKLEQMSKDMYAAGMVEYIEMVNNPRRFYWRNFVMGIARGFGMAIGFTIIAAVIIYVMRQVMALNIPLIGDFIADITEIVINQLGIYR
ncbi:MAG: DUF5665 domain-containing protein [Syntrophomonadaceae bacterium]|nr:DUF5665 domain-containing protein [Syntrophomonadaceae bacterium]